MSSGVDWTAVEGDAGGDVYFTVYDCNGVAEVITGHTVTLKVYENDGTTLKFSGACILVDGGAAGRCKYTITVTDFVFEDERMYFFQLKLDDGAGVIRHTLRADLKVDQGPPE